MKAGCWLALMIAVPTIVLGQTRVTLRTPDGASIEADLYGKGDRAIVIIGHGGYSTRISWSTEASAVANAGYRALVFDTRAATELAAGNDADPNFID